MLQFTAISWLAFPSLVGLVGAFALWRSRARPRAVPSTKLWQGLEGTAGKGTRRHVDPLWLMMLAGAILAALCLAGPQWVTPLPPRAAVDWSVRSTTVNQKSAIDLWIHWREATQDAYTLNVNGKESGVPGKTLRGGTSIPVAAEADLAVRLKDAAGREVASETFHRPAERSFAVLSAAGPDRAIDPALQRAFAVQRGAVPGDPVLRPAVLLANDPSVSASSAAIEEAQLVIAEPATPLPGITLGEWQTAPQEAWAPVTVDSSFKWPAFVSLKAVRVKTLRAATFSNDWQVIATAGGHPWLALRTFPASTPTRAWLWMASEPVNHTQWAADPSLVLFFADLTARFIATNEKIIGVWTADSDSNTPIAEVRWPLNRYLGGLAMVLLVTASAWYVRRAGLSSSQG